MSRTGTKTKKPLRTGVRILVADLCVGHKLVTRWHGKRIGDLHSDLSKEQAQQVMDDFLSGGESVYVSQSHPVDTITLCPGNWRTHIHVNGNQCYDIRQTVWVVQEKEREDNENG